MYSRTWKITNRNKFGGYSHKGKKEACGALTKYRLYPTSKEHWCKVMKTFGVATWTCNQAVQGIKKKRPCYHEDNEGVLFELGCTAHS